MKRIFAFWAALALLFLSACAAREERSERIAELQRQYAALNSCAAQMDVSIVRETETARYTLDAVREKGETRITVIAPEELRGVSAILRDNDGGLRLQFDGMMLDAGSANPKVSALNGFSLLLRAAAEGYVTEQSMERFADMDALRLCFETEADGETLFVTAWFDAENAPLYAEIERDGTILAYLEFTKFTFHDILPAE